MKKRMLSLLLAAVMVCTMIPAAAASGINAADTTRAAGEYTMLSTNGETTGAIKSDGSLWMWGKNSSYQIGKDFPSEVKEPVKVMDNVASVQIANYTSVIKTDGSLWVCGKSYDYNYNLMGATAVQKGSITCIPQLTKVMDNVVSFAEAGVNYAVIKTDGSLWVWGAPFRYQLYDGKTYGYHGLDEDNIRDSNSAVKILDNVVSVAVTETNIAALRSDGTLWIMGDNIFGQIGDGTTTYRAAPVKVMENVVDFAIDYEARASSYVDSKHSGVATSAAVKSDGSLWMWGSNQNGRLSMNQSDGKDSRWLKPTKVMDGVAKISLGGYDADGFAAIKTDNSLWTWGSDNINRGVLGHSDIYAKFTETSAVNYVNKTWSCREPQKIMENVESVYLGRYYAAAIGTDGSLWMWGKASEHGIMSVDVNGNDDKNKNYVTLPRKVLEDVACFATDANGYHYAYAMKSDGSVWGWGWDSGFYYASVGDGDTKETKVPIKIMDTGLRYTRLDLNGGLGAYVVARGENETTLNVPQNPVKPGYTFAGWYTDAALTKPWNFNNNVTSGLKLYAKWTPVSSTAATTSKSKSTITLNGTKVTLDAYSLKADNGGDVTYVKLRDVAALLEKTNVKFNVDWKRGAIYVSTKTAYTTKNGTELKAISGANGTYRWNQAPVLFDGTTKALEGIVITDGNGGGHTFFKLRDLGAAIGFTVDWSQAKGIYIETK